MLDLSWHDWSFVALGALLIGVSKTGIPGIGILAVLLLAAVFPAKASTGLVLPMLIFGDFFAVAYWRRHAVWVHLLRLMPWAAAGVFIGYLLMDRINDAQLRPLIGVIVLAMLALHVWRNRRGPDLSVPTGWWFAAMMGLLAGVTTMMANAAGPIMAIYLLAMRLPKEEFIGTGAWYYLVVNCFKVPFSVKLGLITGKSLLLNLAVTPAIALGAVVGILIVHRLPERAFNVIIQILAAAAAIRLLIPT